MKNNLLRTIVFATLIAPWLLQAQSFNKAKLDSFFDVLSKKNQAMGSLVISKSGKTIYSRAIGYQFVSKNEKIQATTESKYHIGSITKMFTAVMIFQLIEQNKLSLNTPIARYFPGLPNAEKISIENLLNHHSGLHDFTQNKDFGEWMGSAKTEKEMLEIITKGGIDFQPGEKGQYSNSNYVILGYLLEHIYKQPYKNLLQEKIVSKIGLKNTYTGGKISTKNKECFSYIYSGTEWMQLPESDLSIPGGAGAILSTPADLTHFIEALFSYKLISQGSLNQMKAIKDDYGMGIFESFYLKTSYGHNGRIDGFVSDLSYYPDDSLAIAYCSNGVECSLNDIIKGVLNIYFGKSFTIPTFEKQHLDLSSEDLNKYLGVYTSKEFPMTITITKENKQLFAEATGQSKLPMDPTGQNEFSFDKAGITLIFAPEKNAMLLKQRGSSLVFERQK